MANRRLFARVNFMLSKALSTSFVSASNVISSFSTSIFDCSTQDLQLLRVTCRESNVSGSLHLKSFLKELSKRFATASVVPPRRSRHRDTILGDLRRDCKRKRGTRFRRSWNHPSTLLTTCLSKIDATSRVPFTCYCRVWPTCQLLLMSFR